MSGTLKLKGGTATFLATYIGAANEVIVDETNQRLILHDGVTPGGIPLAKFSDLASASGSQASPAAALLIDAFGKDLT